jgi:non-specific protein-tyrosine kinase
MDDSTNFSFEFRRYIALFWHWAWLLALMAALAGGAAYISSIWTTPVYQATTLVLINEAPLNMTTSYSMLTTSERLAQTYSQVMTTRPVLEAVAQDLGFEKGYADNLEKNIQVQPVQNTSLMTIHVEDTDPALAANIANTLVEVFAEQNLAAQAARYAASKLSLETQMAQIDQQIQSTNDQLSLLEDIPANKVDRDQLTYTLSQYRQTYASLSQSYEEIRLAEAQSISNIIQKEPAIPPVSPIRPQVMRSTLLGAAVGLMLAAGLVFLIEMLDETLKDPQEVTRRFGLPILGLIATHASEDGTLITQSQPRSPAAEAFRALRTNLQYTSVDHPLHTLLITSPSPEDGKSTIAANLSVVLAQGGRNVALVDADLRRPRQHRLMSVTNRPGLSELFVDPDLVLDGNLQKTKIELLLTLSAGKTPPNPSELLGSDKMNRILEQLCKRSEMVVIDSPPVLAVTDAIVLSPRVDGVLLVVKPRITKLPALKQSIEQLQQVGANILGVVLNDVEIKRGGYQYYYYYKAYQHAYQNRYTQNPTKPAKLPRSWKSFLSSWKTLIKG